jgi:hypothetical protein
MMVRLLIIVVTVSFLAVSCRSTRNIQTAIAKKDSVPALPGSADPREDSSAVIRQTLARIEAAKIDFTTFSARVKVDYQGADGKKYDLTANLRMFKDSVIWISITATMLGIEALRAYITPDSVKLLNKQDKIYTARSVAYLQEVTALPLDLHSLQDIFVGNPVFLDSNIISYARAENSISLLSAGDWFKNLLILDGNARVENSKLDDLDKSRSRTCNLSYSDYEVKQGVLFSTRRRITVAEKSNLDIKLDFKNYDFNKTLSLPFTVPKNYQRN